MPALPFGDIGPVRAYWCYGGSYEIELNPYLGKIVIRGVESGKDVQEEEQGEGPVDYVTSGRVVEAVEIPMTRSTLVQLEAALAEPGDLDGTGKVLKLRNNVGCARYEDSCSLVLKPVCNGIVSGLPEEWIELYKTYPTWDWEIGFDREEQRVFMVKFKVFVCQDSPHVGEYGTLGML